jgi:hypothetical protein
MAFASVSAATSRVLARLRRSEILKGVLVGVAAGALVLPLVVSRAPSRSPGIIATAAAVAPVSRRADLGDATASDDVRAIADWIAATGDAGGGPFVVVDKQYAQLHVFDAGARLTASTPILLGGARGDDTVPGIGSRPIEKVLPEERTTPAGRFVGERGMNARGEDVVWVDYDSGVSMHRVLTTDPSERRLERLATPTHEDNRISWGCINVPVAFYEAELRPMFATRKAIVYVLPEIRTLAEVFGMREPAAAGRTVFAQRASVQDSLP